MEEQQTKKPKLNIKDKFNKKNCIIIGVVAAIIIFLVYCYFTPKYNIANKSLYESEYQYAQQTYPKDGNFITCIESMNLYVQMAQENASDDGTYVGSDYDDLVMAKMDFISDLAKDELNLAVNKDEVENLKLYIPSNYHKNLDMILKQLPDKVDKVNKEFNKIKKEYDGTPLNYNQVQAFNDAYTEYYKLIEAMNNLAIKSIY